MNDKLKEVLCKCWTAYDSNARRERGFVPTVRITNPDCRKHSTDSPDA